MNFLMLSALLCLLLITINKILAPKNPNKIKNSSVECAVQPFLNTKMNFNSNYYLVLILFIIFNIVIVVLIPFAMAYKKIINKWSMGNARFYYYASSSMKRN